MPEARQGCAESDGSCAHHRPVRLSWAKRKRLAPPSGSTEKRQLLAPEWAAMRGAGKARRRRALRLRLGWTLRAHARKEEQRGQCIAARLNRVRSALTQEVRPVVATNARVHAVYPAAESGQLPFLGACRTWGVEAKFGPSEDSFCRVCRPIAVAMGQKAGKKWTAAAKLQPTIPKSDRLLGSNCSPGRWQWRCPQACMAAPAQVL